MRLRCSLGGDSHRNDWLMADIGGQRWLCVMIGDSDDERAVSSRRGLSFESADESVVENSRKTTSSRENRKNLMPGGHRPSCKTP